MQIYISRKQNTGNLKTSYLGPDEAVKAMEFHKSLEGYAQTPLYSLEALAEEMGVGGIYVKDESYRFGLNSFKSLGGSYAMFKYLEKMEARKKLVFITATDGNHGRGIAWAAKMLGHKAVVYMPAGSSSERLDNIIKLGADAQITDCNYDDTVRLAKKTAKENGWILIQDTAWSGYEEIPKWIMQGYTTMARETFCQMEDSGVCPTHVILQVGVGSMAAAVTGYLKEAYGSRCPIIIVAEPAKADCVFKTAVLHNDSLQTVKGNLDTIMAGLACGEPSTLGWSVLKSEVTAFVSCPDFVAALGMRLLAAPLGMDKQIVSGESGAVGVGVLGEFMWNSDYENERNALNLNSDSIVLLFSTEGDTDKKNYKKIVWGGAYNHC